MLAQRDFGSALVLGHKVERDRSRGLELLRQAAARGDGTAMEQLAVALSNDDATCAERGEAEHWFMQAALKGLVQSQRHVGVRHLDGEYPSQAALDAGLAAAQRWLTAAAEQDDVCAQWRLGVALLPGEEFPTNLPHAVYWLRRCVKRCEQTGEQAPPRIHEHYTNAVNELRLSRLVN